MKRAPHKRGKKMYAICDPFGNIELSTLRNTATQCKKDWTGGDIDTWDDEWEAGGFRCFPIRVNAEIEISFDRFRKYMLSAISMKTQAAGKE